MLLSHSYLLCHNTLYKNIYIAPDRTRFEREKHRKLVTELRDRCSKGETGLIHNGAIITKSPAGSNSATTESSIPSASNQSS